MATKWKVTVEPAIQADKISGDIGPALFEWIDDIEGVLFSHRYSSIRQTAEGVMMVKAELETMRDEALDTSVKPDNAMTIEMNKGAV